MGISIPFFCILVVIPHISIAISGYLSVSWKTSQQAKTHITGGFFI